jgi:hypothetical protein
LVRAGIEPEAAFAGEDARQLRFATNQPALEIVRVRRGHMIRPLTPCYEFGQNMGRRRHMIPQS